MALRTKVCSKGARFTQYKVVSQFDAFPVLCGAHNSKCLYRMVYMLYTLALRDQRVVMRFAAKLFLLLSRIAVCMLFVTYLAALTGDTILRSWRRVRWTRRLLALCYEVINVTPHQVCVYA